VIVLEMWQCGLC